MGNQENTEHERAVHIAHEAGVPLNFSMHRNGAVGAFTLDELLKLIDSAVEYGARRAPVVPPWHEIAPPEATLAMLVAGNHGQPGYFSAAKCWTDMLGAAKRAHLMSALAAAPQPPEADHTEQPLEMVADHIPDAGQMVAAPVQLPWPQAEIEVRSMKTYLDLSIHEWRDTLPDGTYKIYTEEQVRQLFQAKTTANADGASASSS